MLVHPLHQPDFIPECFLVQRFARESEDIFIIHNRSQMILSLIGHGQVLHRERREVFFDQPPDVGFFGHTKSVSAEA